ncbi:tryptophan--tRNA ligase [Dethiobacter alkaliphilus]|uniref:Tryptophan--tRNA ligase n=1 Tax=Dethiobacter alkaliphilus AHT 1 TaxID=555088 RepID=C0GDZ1_DETAL|nr:tryptophan--tRNA ligase [Dethiobacter alkaliphilus]EEG78285.1 tryptophanyl-tRNA synthetase [Dethiobacter alkaliphilus AHT 1]MCW3491457.1 tryptophan--tRNA ligase [Dethiobacter alkaliphilus]
MTQQKTILSGMRPTGRLQLGNLLGALDNWVKLQDQYRCFFSVVDWHALTTGYEDTSQLRENTYEMVLDWLSAGLDPEKNVIFRQSDVKEHAELHLLFSMITPLSWLERVPTYKDQIEQLKEKNLATYGFLGYPLLQSADILVYRADAVPVGEDQAPHVEMTREVARRFNFMYNKAVFPEPETLLNEVKLLPGIDGRKMSKSYGNTIEMSESPDVLRKKVNQMVTDPGRIKKTDPGNPDVCTVFTFHNLFSGAEVATVEAVCRKGEIGCVQCKKQLGERMQGFMEPIYERRQQLANKKDDIRGILEDGAKRAGEVAAETMETVREVMNLNL